MKKIERTELAPYGGVIRALVAQENSRGDNLSVELLQSDLIAGNQFMLTFTKAPEPDAPPLLVLLCQSSLDRVRGVPMLWVHNFYMHNRAEFDAADWSAEAREFDAVTASFKAVQFMTDNPALLTFLGGLGYYAKCSAIVCELTKEISERTTAHSAALSLAAKEV